jgi:hypothetical protein
MRFALQKNVPHFLVLGDDDRIKFVLESYEKDYLEKITSNLSKFENEHPLKLIVPNGYRTNFKQTNKHEELS